VEFRVLGPLEVVVDGQAAAPSGAKERAVLTRLLIDPGRPVSTDALLEAAWPDRSARDAGHSLQVRLTNLRSFLEPDRARGAPSTVLVREGDGYRLAVDAEQVDTRRFERLVAEASDLAPAAALQAYEDALALWRGAPFGESAYADFAQPEIRRLEELHARAREGRARALVELGRHEEALPELGRLVKEEPLHEELGRSFALGLYRAGRQVEALEALRALATGLAELGLVPGLETQELERRILVHDPALAPVAASGRRPAALPRSVSRFFGRDDELDEAARLLGERPLLTVAGPGGAGKTRFALEVAGLLEQRFPDGRWWCELAPVGSDGGVAGAAAAAVGVEGGVERLAEHLAPRRGLIVLDNCEHVAEGAGELAAELVARCPDLRIVATSRVPLGVEGEHLLRLGGLAADSGGDSPAVAMFADRARAAGALVDPFAQPEAVSELCRRLDGLPLAIELVAARTRSATPAEIAARFAVLDLSGGRTKEARHSTLRAAIDWSHDLLDLPRQLLFRRLSVFSRAAGLDAVADVCSGDGVDRGAVPELLDGLVAHSMVTVTAGNGGTRYGLLETLREYAAERLDAGGELARLRDRHADHYVARARPLEGLSAPAELPFVDELDDVRAALRRCMEADPGPDRAFTLLVPLWGTAAARLAGEIARQAQAALDHWPQAHDLRTGVLETAATAWLFAGDLAAARRLADEALACGQESGDPALLARRAIAHMALYSRDRREALDLTREVIARARAEGEAWLACECEGFAVQLLQAAGDRRGAAELAAGMREGAEELGIPFMTCWARYVSGVAELDGDLSEARRWLLAAIELGVEAGHHHMVHYSLRAFGVAALRDGDHAEAAQRLLAALAHEESQTDAASQWTTIVAIAALVADLGRTERAAELLAAGDGWPAAPYLVELADRTRERVGESGRADRLGLAEAKALARAELAELARARR
jgi:predicted ATPase/DNA-binding SARP family transcriptional activator